ncbi:MAG: cytochrome c [Dechloromonas sp.]|nr:cytochrome c [Dechloromonas sp.]
MYRNKLIACLLVACTAGTGYGGEPTTERQKELVRLVRQDCGSCHGMTLAGGLGTPLLPATLKDKPAEGLVATILLGRPGTAMPPWERFVNEAEARWIVDKLMTEFPR